MNRGHHERGVLAGLMAQTAPKGWPRLPCCRRGVESGRDGTGQRIDKFSREGRGVGLCESGAELGAGDRGKFPWLEILVGHGELGVCVGCPPTTNFRSATFFVVEIDDNWHVFRSFSFPNGQSAFDGFVRV